MGGGVGRAKLLADWKPTRLWTLNSPLSPPYPVHKKVKSANPLFIYFWCLVTSILSLKSDEYIDRAKEKFGHYDTFPVF